MKTTKRTNVALAFGERLSGLLKSAVALVLIAGIVINFSNVIGRFVFASPVHWAEEILTYMLVWLTFLAAGSIAWDGSHLSIDLLRTAFKGVARKILVSISLIATIGISLVMLKQSWSMLSRFLANEQTSLVAQMQLEWAHGPVPVGFGLLALLLALRFFGRLEIEHDVLEEEAGTSNPVADTTELDTETMTQSAANDGDAAVTTKSAEAV